MHFFTKFSLCNPSPRVKPSRCANLYQSVSRGAVEGYGLLNRQVAIAPLDVFNPLQDSLTAEMENAGRGGKNTLLKRLIPSDIRAISLDCGSGKPSVLNTLFVSPSLEMTN